MAQKLSIRLLLVLCVAVVLSWICGLGPSVEMPVAPGAMAQQDGHRFAVAVPPEILGSLLIPADSNDDPAASTAVVHENGVPISLPHRIVAAISERGHGRLSHWGSGAAQIVYLSSSDGTDPRSNGRAYSIRFVALPPGWLVSLAALVLLAAVAIRAAAWSWTIPAAIVLVACVVGVWIRLFAGSVMISPDSAAYIRFHPWVPLGYPAFVAVVSSALGFTSIPAVQLVLLGLAALYVASAVGQLTGSRVACAAVALGVAGEAPIMRYAGYVLSEALYAALLLVCAGAGLRLVKHFSRSAGVTFSLAAALAWSVRPAGVFLVLVGVYLALLVRDVRARTALAWIVVPTLGGFALVQLIHAQVRGPAAISQTGRILFGQVALRFDPGTARDEYRADAERLAAAVAPFRTELEALPGWSDRHRFAVRNYPDRLEAVDAMLRATPGRDPRYDARMLAGLALDSVVARPGAYLRWVLEDVVWSWRTNVCASLALPPAVALGWYADVPEERDRLIRRFSLPLTVEQVTIVEERVSSPAARAVDLLRRVLDAVFGFAPLLLLLGVALLIAVVVAPFSASPTVRALGLLGAMVHGAVTVISATTAPIDRYMAPTDPLLLVAAVLLCVLGASYSSGWNR